MDHTRKKRSLPPSVWLISSALLVLLPLITGQGLAPCLAIATFFFIVGASLLKKKSEQKRTT